MQLADFNLAADMLADFPYDREWIDAGLKRRCGVLFTNDDHSAAIFHPGPHGGNVGFVTGLGDIGGVVAVYLDHVVRHHPESPYLSCASDATADSFCQQFPDRFVAGKRVTYRFTPAKVDWIRDWRDRVPAGFEIRTADLALSRAPKEIDPDIGAFWESPREMVDDSLTFCLMQGDTIVSLAGSPFPLAERITIGVATAPDYRGKGFSPLTCCPLIEYCLNNGIAPAWTTDYNNWPSRTVAEKLGFVIDVQHVWLLVSPK